MQAPRRAEGWETVPHPQATPAVVDGVRAAQEHRGDHESQERNGPGHVAGTGTAGGGLAVLAFAAGAGAGSSMRVV